MSSHVNKEGKITFPLICFLHSFCVDCKLSFRNDLKLIAKLKVISWRQYFYLYRVIILERPFFHFLDSIQLLCSLNCLFLTACDNCLLFIPLFYPKYIVNISYHFRNYDTRTVLYLENLSWNRKKTCHEIDFSVRGTWKTTIGVRKITRPNLISRRKTKEVMEKPKSEYSKVWGEKRIHLYHWWKYKLI